MPEASKFYDLCQSDRDGYYYKRNLYHMLTYGILLNLFSGLAFAPQLCPAAAWSILINLHGKLILQPAVRSFFSAW